MVVVGSGGSGESIGEGGVVLRGVGEVGQL